MHVIQDFEFRSVLDIKKVGLYRLMAHPSTEPLCMAYKIVHDDGYAEPTKLLRWENLADLWHPTTARYLDLLEDETVELHAHNAAVERLAIEMVMGPRYGWPVPRRSRWRCSAARIGRLAVPRKLEKAAIALKLTDLKDLDGHKVMLRLTKPRKFDPNTGAPIWDEDPVKFERMYEYCKQDVNTEYAVERATFPMTPMEQNRYLLIERMNDRGVRVDIPLIKTLLARARDAGGELDEEMRELTGGAVTRVTNVAKLKEWIEQVSGVRLDRLRKEDLENLDADAFESCPEAQRAIELRQMGAKSSVSKLTAILARANDDGILRGAFMAFTTSTGRLTSVGVQLQNLPRETLKDYDKRVAEPETLSIKEISTAIRGVIIPRETDHVYVDADFNAIEARGVGWLARAKKLVQTFQNNGDPYCDIACVIYNRTITKQDENERFVGKQTILGCGYGMGAPKFEAQCIKFGKPVGYAVAEKAVKAYRTDFPEIPDLWKGIEKAAIAAVEHPGRVTAYLDIEFKVKSGYLQMRLPSGRLLYYHTPTIRDKPAPWDRSIKLPCLYYMAEHPLKKIWMPESTWGGKITENAVQALCNDLLMEAQIRIEKRLSSMVLSVHDQAVVECHRRDAERVKSIVQEEMERGEEWSRGFPIKAEPKILERFGK